MQASSVARALAETHWDTLDLAHTLGPDGQVLLGSLRNSAQNDQFTSDLITALVDTRQRVTALVKAQQTIAARPPRPVPGPGPTAPKQAPSATVLPSSADTSSTPIGQRAARRSGECRTTAAAAITDLSMDLAELAELEPAATVEITWRVVE